MGFPAFPAFLWRPAAVPRVRARQKGLLMLGAYLALSGALRIGNGVGQAMAEATIPAVEGVTPSDAAPATGAACDAATGSAELLAALQAREAKLKEAEAKAAEREQSQALARSEIERRIAALTEAEQKLAATVAIADQAADKDVTRLVSVYEAMKPKDAARLFAEMDPEFAAGFLAKMRPEAAGAVLAGLDPAKAYAITAHLAGRNALAPKS